MIGVGISGGSQWESNESVSPQVGKLQTTEAGKADKAAKLGRTRDIGVQPRPRKRDGIGPWLEYQRSRRHHSHTRFGMCEAPLTFPEWRECQRERQKKLDDIQWSRIQFLDERVDPLAGPRNGGDDYRYDIRKLINDGKLVCRAVLVREQCMKHALLNWDRRALNARGASEEHSYLKLLGLSWLRSIGAEKAATEVPCGYGSADVYSLDLGIAVECGDTPGERILSVADGSVVAILVLPYGSGDERGSIGGMYFKPGADTQGEIKAGETK